MAIRAIEYVTIEVDGKPVSLRKDKPILWGLRDKGYDIPYFCAHKWLDPLGACRMCMVKVSWNGRPMPKLQISCAMLPGEGMSVETNIEEVLTARREQLEFHLINHPLECPVCDKGGECMLQDQTYEHGCGEGRYTENKKVRPDRQMNAYIQINYKRCIHCKRCVGFTDEIDNSHLLKMVSRGAESWIESYPTSDDLPYFSGNVIDICPVGALTATNYRFTMGRPWEQELTASVASLDSTGVNIWLNGRLGHVARIIPRENEGVDTGMLDDATRFSWEAIDDPARLRKALIHDEGETRRVKLAMAEALCAEQLGAVLSEHPADSVGLVAGGNRSTEEYMSLRHFATRVLDSRWYSFGEDLAGPEGMSDVVLEALLAGNTSIEHILSASTILTIGSDLWEEAPVLGLRANVEVRKRHRRLVNLRSHGSSADDFAEYIDYGYGNLLRTVRATVNALNGNGETTPEGERLAESLRSVGDDCAILYGSEVWKDAAARELIVAIQDLREAVRRANDGCSVYTNPVYPAANSAGALLANWFTKFGRPASAKESCGGVGRVLQAAADGQLQALVICDYDLLSSYPDRALVEKALAKVKLAIYLGSFENPTSQRCRFHMPLGTWAHIDGSVVSLEWRVQKRRRGQIDSVAPSLTELVNGLSGELGRGFLGTTEDMYGQLRHNIEFWPRDEFADFPYKGVLVTPRARLSASRSPVKDLPAERRAGAGELVLIPKSFLYNDRDLLANSPVFARVAMPFHAFMNPADMQAQGISDGDSVALGSVQLTARGRDWVRSGSVVVNDFCHSAPANGMGAAGFTGLSIRKASLAGSQS
ncbi:MAG: 2Fe-2S iron-sulfur cluster-binding protein [bacterium]